MTGLAGAWVLISARFEFADSGEGVDIYGDAPLGRLILTPGGRMSAILTRAGREAARQDQAALFASMMAYSGAYRVEDGTRFVTDVDVAWTPDWVGTAQVRAFEIDGDTLSLLSAEQEHPLFPGRPGRGRLSWRRDL